QAEDGIRDATVTGVQTCALPICIRHLPFLGAALTVTATTLFLRRWVRKSQFGKGRRIETAVSESRGRAVPKPLTAPLGILPRGKIGRASCREVTDVEVEGVDG